MLILSAVLASLAATPYACPAQMTLDSQTMGPLHLGDGVAVVTQDYKYRSEVFADDGDGGIRYTVAVCGQADIVAETFGKDTVIGRLRTASPIFVTEKGAHVGMSVEALKRLYSQGEVSLSEIEGTYASFATKEGVYFSLDQSHIPVRCYEARVDCRNELQSVTAVTAFIQK